jgi:PEGA domain
MKKLTSCVVLFSLLFVLSSCATLFKGTSEEVRFGSEPQKAEVWVNGTKMGETPISLKLETKKTYDIEFKKEGFKSVTRRIINHVGAGWIVLDVLAGLVPVIVDAATGAWYSLDQKNVDAVLEKQ